MEVRQKIRALIGKYGLRATREAMEAEAQDAFAYLQGVYPPKEPRAINTTVILDRETIPDILLPESTEDSPTGDAPAASLNEAVAQEEGVKTVTVTGSAAAVKLSKEESRAKREKHEEIIQKKRADLIQKGVVPSSVLTKENLTAWMKEGKTYWQIAEETGCKDAEVSAAAKSFGLQSTMSKYIIAKRAMKSKE